VTGKHAVAAALLVGSVGGAIVGTVHLARGQMGGSSAPLSTVEVTNRVDVSATTPPGTWLGVAGDESGTRLQAEVANVPGSYLSVGDDQFCGDLTVNLGQAAMALLAGRTCVYGPIGHRLVGSTPAAIPGMLGRTGVLLVAHNFGAQVDYVSCWPGLPDGGNSPNCAVGDAGVGVPVHNQGSVGFDVSDAYVVRCISCLHGGGGAGTALLGGANSQCTP
jgi:hypothetical protein